MTHSSPEIETGDDAKDQLVDFAELKLLIDEYDPANSDWNFRRGVLLDILMRLWPKAPVRINGLREGE